MKAKKVVVKKSGSFKGKSDKSGFGKKPMMKGVGGMMDKISTGAKLFLKRVGMKGR